MSEGGRIMHNIHPMCTRAPTHMPHQCAMLRDRGAERVRCLRVLSSKDSGALAGEIKGVCRKAAPFRANELRQNSTPRCCDHNKTIMKLRIGDYIFYDALGKIETRNQRMQGLGSEQAVGIYEHHPTNDKEATT